MVDGFGAGGFTDQQVTIGGNGMPSGMYFRSWNAYPENGGVGFEIIVRDEVSWSRQPGTPWEVSESNPIIPMSEWSEEYTGATDFRLGRQETIAGERCRFISFMAPATSGRVAAWYAWWVGLDSGRVYRETMVSRKHYMVNEFSAFDAPVELAPPRGAPAAPPATPSATAGRVPARRIAPA